MLDCNLGNNPGHAFQFSELLLSDIYPVDERDFCASENCNPSNHDDPFIRADDIGTWDIPIGSVLQQMYDPDAHNNYLDEVYASEYNYMVDPAEDYPQPIFYIIPSLEERVVLAKKNTSKLKKVFGFEKVKVACQIVAERKWFWGMIESWEEVFNATKAEVKKLLKEERMQKAS